MEILYKFRNSTAGLTGPKITFEPQKVLHYSYEIEREDGSPETAVIIFSGVQWLEIYHEPAEAAKIGERQRDRVLDLGVTDQLKRIAKSVAQYYHDRGDRSNDLRHIRLDPDNGPQLDLICEGFEVLGPL